MATEPLPFWDSQSGEESVRLHDPCRYGVLKAARDHCGCTPLRNSEMAHMTPHVAPRYQAFSPKKIVKGLFFLSNISPPG